MVRIGPGSGGGSSNGQDQQQEEEIPQATGTGLLGPGEVAEQQDQQQSSLADQLNPQTEVERRAVEEASSYAEAQRLVTQYRQEGLPGEQGETQQDAQPTQTQPSQTGVLGPGEVAQEQDQEQRPQDGFGTPEFIREQQEQQTDTQPEPDPVSEPTPTGRIGPGDVAQEQDQQPEPEPEPTQEPTDTGALGPGETATQQDQQRQDLADRQGRQTGVQGLGETAEALDPFREAEDVVEETAGDVSEAGQEAVETFEQAVPFDPSELQQDRQRPQGRGLTDPSVNNPDFGEGTGLDDIGAGALDAGSDVVEGAVDAAPDDPLGAGADFVGDSFGVATDVTGDVFSGTADFIGNNTVSDTVVGAGDLIGDAEEALGEPITGPPGMVESTLGSVGSDIAEASQDAAGFANENVVDPYTDIVATTAEDISRGEVPTIEDFQDEPETKPGQAVDALFTGAGEEVTGFTVGLPNALYQGVEGAGDAAEFTFSNIEQEGLAEGISETGEATADLASQLGAVAYQEFRENPVESVGRLAGGLAAGSALAKGLEKSTDIARGLNVKRQGDTPEIPFEDITTEAGLRGSLPDFTTDPDAPTSQAVDEIRRRARANPDEIIPGESEGAIFHTTGDRLGPDLEVGEGRSELPGLFGSPKASPIGLERIGGRGYDLSLRLPDLRPDSDRIVTLPGDDIEGMPDWAQGAGYELRTPEGDVDVRGLTRGQAKARAEGTDLEVRPQSNTGGYQYLTEEAPPGTFQVRPQGARTPELEAITPPGGRFIEEGVTPVRLGGIDIPFTDTRIPGTGRVVPARRFTRADTDADVDTPSGTGTGTVDDTSALSLPTSQLSRRSGTPVGPPLFGTSTPGAGSQPGVFGQETIPGESTTGTGGTGSGTTGGSDVFGNLISDVSGLTGGSGSFFDGFGLEPTLTGTETNTDGGVTDPTRGTTDPSRTRGSTGTGTGTNGGGTGGSSGPSGTGGPFGPIDFTGSGGGSDGPPSGGSPPTRSGSPPGSGPPTGTPPSGGSGTPGSPTGSPPGTPTDMTPTPSGIFGFGASPVAGGNRPRAPFDLNTDDDEDPVPEIAPQGQEFENPLVSGRSFLLGGTTTGEPQDGASGLFSGGVDTDASGSLFGFDRDDGPAADPFGMGEFFNG